MGRPPSNGVPCFRFNPTEVTEMEAVLQAHNTQVPPHEIFVSLAEKFSASTERYGKVVVQAKQVLNWFQNRRHALRARAAKPPVELSASPVPPNDFASVRNVPQAPQHVSVPPGPAEITGRNSLGYFQMEFEAKSARDGAWYDVELFLSYRSVETADPEVLVRLSGFGPQEDEWVSICKYVRQRSLPCESTDCVAVLIGDMILCFQESEDHALYFDARVVNVKRRRHDARGCRCSFLVCYVHDQSLEIVPLRKVCRRPETNYRIRQLQSDSATTTGNKTAFHSNFGNTVNVFPSSEAIRQQHKAEALAEREEQLPKAAEVLANTGPFMVPVSQANASTTAAAVVDGIVHVNSAAAADVTPAATSTSNPTVISNASGTTSLPVAAVDDCALVAESKGFPGNVSEVDAINMQNTDTQLVEIKSVN